MSDTVWAAIVGGVAGIVTSSVTTLFGPLVHWDIEKKRKKRDDRIEAIHRWREMVMSWRFFSPHNQPTTVHLELERSWISLEPQLSQSTLQEISRYQGRQITYAELEEFENFMLLEIAKLERKWKLV
jgi:hypothetical protein